MECTTGEEAHFHARADWAAFVAAGWLALAAGGLASAFGVESAQATFPGANGRIAFAVDTWRPADPCLPAHGCEPELVASTIETVLPSGRGRRPLYAFRGGRGVAGESAPAWSPDGGRLAFQQAGRLAIIRRDGTRLRRLPRATDWDSEPAWAPDGRRLAFVGSGPPGLFTVSPKGTALRRVTDQAAHTPAWSVTGRIAFAHRLDRYAEPGSARNGLYTIKPDGTRLRRLARAFKHPDWSPDGSRIAFHGHGQIYTLGADGRGLRRLTSFKHSRSITGPVWSPDGRFVAFARVYDLYVIRADGRGLLRILDAQSLLDQPPGRPWSEASAPAWQPLPR